MVEPQGCHCIRAVEQPWQHCMGRLHAGGLKDPNIQLNTLGQEVHMGVACDSCGLCPIVGPRFNSQVVMNYDLCSRCHALPGADSVAPFRLVQNQSGMSTSTKVALLFGDVTHCACQACQDQGLGTLKCLPSSSSKG